MIKAVIYDFDGTLADTLKVSFDAYVVALSKLGLKPEEKEILDYCFNKLDSEVAKTFNVDLKSFTKLYKEATIKGYKTAELHDNVIDTLIGLKKIGIKLAIGTSKDKKKVAKIITKFKLKKYFDVIVTNDSCLKKKNEIFVEVCDKLDLDPKDVLIVGDADNDMDAANQIGAKSALYFPKEHEKYYDINFLKKLKPDNILKDHKQILEIVLE